MINKTEAIKSINSLAESGMPFLLISDFSGQQNYVIPSDQIDEREVLFAINGHTNATPESNPAKSINLKKWPLPFEAYAKTFKKVHAELSVGNSYLLNLTCPTKINLDCSLKAVFENTKARYKLWFRDEFVVYSPEIFVQIGDGKISSFPMKGTIDANLPNARETILADKKEMAEHTTIVDLIRNDMSVHAKNVKVEKFRYIDEVNTNDKNLLQVSSKITGDLEKDYLSRLGEIVFSLLPAGSICGAPKSKTLSIIEETEGYDRGFYTGIMGYFDGQSFDSGVMIRFIQKENDELMYKSGGGIHFLSDAKDEYQEMIDKVYVPIH